MSETQRTHYDGCWRDRAHHGCALAEIARLTAEVERLRGGVVDTRRRELVYVAKEANRMAALGINEMRDACHDLSAWADNRGSAALAQRADAQEVPDGE